ncbi:hypothetical protein [Nitrososphaera sp.]|uniref:hypothetical protein n=1 Tax=Nitrososphaera sp. TaxID=1971748 RepID=UPI00179A34C3|nr:hypothetical protein [Nitrososphaera sp.]NWG36110.1 hypothetical protein [Nitrososphaera sp.]
MKSKRPRARGREDGHHSAAVKDILSKLPKLDEHKKQSVAGISKTAGVLLLRLRVLDTLRHYSSITVRMLFYRLVSLYRYPNDRKFYKRLGYSLKKLRRLFPDIEEKFDDPTRQVRMPEMPDAKIELWVEKSSLEHFLEKLAAKYHVPILAQRGFGSLTMFRKALQRARKRGVRKVLLLGDHDPSGLRIDEVTRHEMESLGLEIERIALTMQQVKRYRLPAIRTKRKDSRSKGYVEKFGNRAWEVESLPPRTLLRIVEKKLKENVPAGFLQELRETEQAERISRPVEQKLARLLRKRSMQLKRQGLSDKEIRKKLAEEFLKD